MLDIWLTESLEWKGFYTDLEYGLKGAPGAMIIHWNKNQNLEQNTQECDCQHWDAELKPLQTKQCLKMEYPFLM